MTVGGRTENTRGLNITDLWAKLKRHMCICELRACMFTYECWGRHLPTRPLRPPCCLLCSHSCFPASCCTLLRHSPSTESGLGSRGHKHLPSDKLWWRMKMKTDHIVKNNNSALSEEMICRKFSKDEKGIRDKWTDVSFRSCRYTLWNVYFSITA